MPRALDRLDVVLETLVLSVHDECKEIAFLGSSELSVDLRQIDLRIVVVVVFSIIVIVRNAFVGSVDVAVVVERSVGFDCVSDNCINVVFVVVRALIVNIVVIASDDALAFRPTCVRRRRCSHCVRACLRQISLTAPVDEVRPVCPNQQ